MTWFRILPVFVAAGVWAAAPEYTPARAEAGRVAFGNTCGRCHTENPDLSSMPADWQTMLQREGGAAPALSGPEFRARWAGRSTGELAKRIDDAVGAFPPKGRNAETYLDLTAYVLQMNGMKPDGR